MRLSLVGDVHLRFDAREAAAIDAARPDAALFVGDLGGYSHRGGLRIARAIAALRTPALVVPGNHDATHPQQLLAEMTRHAPTIELLASGQRARVAELRRALGPAILAGYSVHPLRAGDDRIDCVVGRPHSFGGPHLAFRPYLRDAFGIESMEQSAERLCELVDRTETERILVLAHNGPTGLGARRHDLWGCDFRSSEGDFGDPDLRVAIEHARERGKRVVAVLAGHMHHALRGGGERTWIAREGDTLFVNAARVPRVWKHHGTTVSHRIEITIEGAHAEAREVIEAAPLA